MGLIVSYESVSPIPEEGHTVIIHSFSLSLSTSARLLAGNKIFQTFQTFQIENMQPPVFHTWKN